MDTPRLRLDQSIFTDIELGRVCAVIQAPDVIDQGSICGKQAFWSVEQIL